MVCPVVCFLLETLVFSGSAEQTMLSEGEAML